jgi:hypothetical protein
MRSSPFRKASLRQPSVVALLLLSCASVVEAQSIQPATIAPVAAAHAALMPSTLLALPRPNTKPLPPAAIERWVDSTRVDRLEASLVELAQADGVVRTWGAIGGLVLGGLVTAGTTAIAASTNRDWGGNGRAAFCAVGWTAGAGLIAAALFRMFARTPAEERLLRWSGLRQDHKLDVFEFTRFEGELQSEAESARYNRRLSGYVSFGVSATGGALLALSATDQLEGDSETAGYALGGTLIGIGVIQSLTLFLTRTPAEKAWRHYAEGGGGFYSEAARPHLAWRD